jgi:hypothetical protein
MMDLALSVLAGAIVGGLIGFVIAGLLWSRRDADLRHADVIAGLLWSRRDANLRHVGVEPIDELEVVIADAGDGTRVWINTELGCIARWYRVDKVTITDRRRS